MNRKIAAGVFLAVVLGCVSPELGLGGGPRVAVPKPVARFAFDGSTVAELAEGKTAGPLEAKAVAFTEGLKSQGLQAGSGIVLRYARELLPAQRGSVSMWVRLTMPLGKAHWRFFFSDGTDWGRMGMPRLWLMRGNLIRYDLDGGSRYFIRPLPLWPLGQWKHLAFTWDAVAGKTAAYCNGKQLGALETASWQAGPSESFRIGSGLNIPGTKSNHPAYAAIDEVTIYDQVLTGQQIGEVYRAMQLPELQVRSIDDALGAGAETARLRLTNVGHGRAVGTASWGDSATQPGSERFDLGHGDSLVLNVSVAGRGPGMWRIPVALRGVAHVPDQTVDVPVFIEAPEPTLPDRPIPWRRVAQVDCSKTPPPTSVGKISVVNSAIGSYVEAGPRHGDKFAYGFRLSGADRLVRMTVAYPDDKIRTAQVSAWGPPQEALGSGFSCGDLVPLTNAMVQRQFVFFSKNRDVGIVLGTEAPDQPVAAAKIVVEEAPPQLSPPAPKPALGAKDHRRIGLYWEDPVIARCFGEPDSDAGVEFELILKRCLDYCDWVGLNVISYPALWYPGPIYRSKLTSGYPMGQRQHPPDFLVKTAKRCSQRGVAFIPSFNFWRLDPIAKWIRTEEEVIAGAASINRVEITGKIITWANTGGFVSPKPNILHPVTQQAVKAMIEEVASQCAEYDSFAGIDLMLWPGCPLSFGAAPRTKYVGSYDDYSVGEFAKSINETPPGPAKGRERFVNRIRWINDDPKRKEAWIGWRCERLTDFYRSAAAGLAAIKPGAKLGIGVYDPGAGFEWEGVDMSQVIREIGIDLPALAKDPNIAVRKFVHQMLERYNMRSGGRRAKRVDLGNSKEFQAPFAAIPRMGAIFHQQYFESPVTMLGKALELPAPFPSETEAINPNSGLRVSEPIYGGRDYLRYFAHAVRNFDATVLTVGGYVLGTQGAEPELREFARSFNALPAVLFRTVSEADGVIVRTAEAEQKTWIYALNLSATDRPVTLRLDAGFRNAATGQNMPVADGKATVTLRPYELLSLRSP